MYSQSRLHIFPETRDSKDVIEILKRMFIWTAPPVILDGDNMVVKDLRLLLRDAARRPLIGGTINYVLLNAEAISSEVANTLLKSIEEPPPYLHWHLVTTNESKMLSTIVSRCARMRHDEPFSPEALAVESWEGMSFVEKLKWAEELAKDETALAQLAVWLSMARANKDWPRARSLDELIGKLKKTGTNKRLLLENYVLDNT